MNSVARARLKPHHVPARLKERLAGLLRGTRDIGYLLQTAAVFFTLIPIAFAGFYAYRSAEREMTEAVLGKREHVAYLVATVLTEKLDGLIEVGVSLATRVRFRELIAEGRWNEAIGILASVPSAFPHVERLFLADPKGVLTADTPALPGVRGTNFSHRDWYRGVSRTGRPYVSEIYKRSAAPQLDVIAVAIPITSRRQELLGLLVLQVALEAFFEWFRHAPIGPESMLYVVDRNGRNAFQPHHAPRGDVANLSQAPAVRHALQGRRGVTVGFSQTENAERILAYAPVARYDWGVVLDEPARTAFAARDAQLRRFTVVYALVLLLTGFTVYLLFRTWEQARRKTRLEQEVAERTVALEAANKELEAFSYSVSHDLRAPLRSIDGFSRILLDDCLDKLAEPYRGYLQRVRAAALRMGNLIDDLLKLSRVTRAEIRRDTVDLSALARAVIEELRKTQPRQIAIDIQPGHTAVGDPPLLRVLLENLLDNAWKFTGKTADARIEFGATRNAADRPVYFVRDNGAGFDMTYAAKLFGAFQRLHATEEFPGTGIGLATVRRVIQRHGGRIWAEAALGHGAAFYFTLSERS